MADNSYPGSTPCPLCKTCPKCGLIVHDDKPSMHKPTCKEGAPAGVYDEKGPTAEQQAAKQRGLKLHAALTAFAAHAEEIAGPRRSGRTRRMLEKAVRASCIRNEREIRLGAIVVVACLADVRRAEDMLKSRERWPEDTGFARERVRVVTPRELEDCRRGTDAPVFWDHYVVEQRVYACLKELRQALTDLTHNEDQG